VILRKTRQKRSCLPNRGKGVCFGGAPQLSQTESANRQRPADSNCSSAPYILMATGRFHRGRSSMGSPAPSQLQGTGDGKIHCDEHDRLQNSNDLPNFFDSDQSQP